MRLAKIRIIYGANHSDEWFWPTDVKRISSDTGAILIPSMGQVGFEWYQLAQPIQEAVDELNAALRDENTVEVALDNED